MSQSHADYASPPQGTKAHNYGAYNSKTYAEGLLKHNYPLVTTNPNKLEEQAKSVLSKTSYNYVAGGAGEKSTMDANRLAFRQWKIVPRMLRPSTNHDLRTTLFGHSLNAPILMAPVGVQGIFHSEREIGTATAARELGIPYTHSSAATTSIEDAAAACGDNLRFFQLYWPLKDELTISVLSRAQAAGYSALLVTLDTWHLGWRPDDLDSAYIPFMRGQGIQNFLSDPVFRRLFSESHDGKSVDEAPLAAAAFWQTEVFPGIAHTWTDLAFLRQHWHGPIVLKGIQHVEDAKLAIQYGMDGIYVSNHGGRQLDGALGSLDALAEIAEAVGDKITIIFDSGVRTGTDVIKALALGAHIVGIGRPWVYGLAIDGKEGCKAAMAGILADLDVSMGLAGITSLKECNRQMVRKVQYPGDRFSTY